MPDAYYSPEEMPERFAADVTALATGDVPRWWRQGFDELGPSGEGRTWFDFVQAYEFAGQNLVELMAGHSSQRFRVSLCPPIIFMYRHALELMLKQVEMALDYASGREIQIRGSHTLKDTWSAVRDRVAPGLGDPSQELPLLDEAVEAIQRLDPTSFTFRYPVDRSGALTSNMQPLDPEALARVVTHIIDVLTVALARVEERGGGDDA